MSEERELLAVFARAPELGQVKTRLCPPLTPDQALALHVALVADTLEHLSRLMRSGLSRHLFLSQPLSNPSELVVPKGWTLGIQSQGDLGERLSQLFLTSCGRGIHRVVVVGSDSPTLPLEIVAEAFEQLSTHEVVLGPAEDGGYYLLGARKWIPSIFKDIPWGTAEVLDTTIAALELAEIQYRQLPPWYDVDRDDDLRKLRAEIDYMKRRSSPYVPRRVDEALPIDL